MRESAAMRAPGWPLAVAVTTLERTVVAIGVGVRDEPLTPQVVVGSLLVVAGVAAAAGRRRPAPTATPAALPVARHEDAGPTTP